jgi:hypothetical protein
MNFKLLNYRSKLALILYTVLYFFVYLMPSFAVTSSPVEMPTASADIRLMLNKKFPELMSKYEKVGHIKLFLDEGNLDVVRFSGKGCKKVFCPAYFFDTNHNLLFIKYIPEKFRIFDVYNRFCDTCEKILTIEFSSNDGDFVIMGYSDSFFYIENGVELENE